MGGLGLLCHLGVAPREAWEGSLSAMARRKRKAQAISEAETEASAARQAPVSAGDGGMDGEAQTPATVVDADVGGSAEAAAAEAADQSPPSELEQLRAQLEVERVRGDELLRQVADARNEMEAVQRRSEQQLERSRRHLLTEFLRELLPVLDELQHAVDAANTARADASGDGSVGETGGPLLEGLHLTRRNLLELLRRNGLEELDPQGQAFDPLFHEAVASVVPEDSSVAANTVMQVVQRGYTLHDRLLRAARVVVTAVPSTRDDGTQAAADSEPEQNGGSEHNGMST